MFYLGFDIGGSSVKAVLVKDKKIVKSEVKDLPNNLGVLLESISEIKKNFSADKVEGVGFALAGMLDLEREKMIKSPNIAWLDGQPVRKLFEEKLSLPVRVEHDACCFLLAEKEMGLARGLKNVCLLTFGAGVGGAWTLDGKIFAGAHGNAGEVGHTIINEKTFEELASNKFVAEKLGVGSAEAFERARAGDARAAKVLADLGKNIGLGVANIINIFDPEAVILAGGIMDARDFIVSDIEETKRKFVVSPAAKETKILFSALGRFGGAKGAALLCVRNEQHV